MAQLISSGVTTPRALGAVVTECIAKIMDNKTNDHIWELDSSKFETIS
jgi:hypothetical protein